MRPARILALALGLGIVIIAAGCIHSRRLSTSVQSSDEWPCYGRDAGGLRYSPLRDIHRGNVSHLREVWTYRTGDLETQTGRAFQSKAAFESTPIMIGGVLYFSTATCRVIALDASNGRELWVYDPGIPLEWNYSEVTSRGVAFWAGRAGSTDHSRIFLGTLDGRLIALHAATGKPVQDFGVNGEIDLLKDVGRGDTRTPGQYQMTSPPAILGDQVIIGSSIGDNRAVKLERGIVRAYDARTGRLRWSWDPIPKDRSDPAFSTWQGGSASETGAANAWAPLSADVERDLVFVPTSSPSPDYFGGTRLGANLYANCVVALRGTTGQVVWSFQTVHHDLWDYDVPMQPVLIEVNRRGRPVPAVAVGTKSGHIFILDRQTGKPLFPVKEEPVPASDVRGEESWPTQPFPQRLPRFGLQKVTVEEAWGLTPAELEEARNRISQLRSDGPFTPPSLRGSIHAPSSVGGFHWGGLSYDPARQILLGPVNRLANIITLVPREALDPPGSGRRFQGETGSMAGTPYVVQRDYLLKRTPAPVPMTAPPWGTLAAVNLGTGRLQWEVPLGWMLDPTEHPAARTWGSANLGGAITTAGGLTFIGATLDNHFRAFDTANGALLWEMKLPASAQATPMTYRVGGRQFVLICAGGHGKLGSKQGDYVIAFGTSAPAGLKKSYK